jgi:hypothetical protein
MLLKTVNYAQLKPIYGEPIASSVDGHILVFRL